MKKYVHILLFVLAPILTSAQAGFNISGKVVDGAGYPIEGATISLSGTESKTITNPDGVFQLSSQRSDVSITVSFIGFKTLEQQVKLPLDRPLLITLKSDNRELKEVIVSTGYEELPRERSTGSFEQIDPELINRSVSPNILSRLEGLSPSVFFDNRNFNINGSATSNNLLVRGLSTLDSDTNPLIILDNFPYEGDINNINPNDVESITILKDAAAASIWGARAGNGVIIINSKKGGFNKPLSISFTSNVNVTGKPNLFDNPQLSSADFIDVEQFLFSRGFYNSQENNVRKPALTPVVELLIAQRDGRISPAELETQLNIFRKRDVRNDFTNYVYREAVNQQYAMNLTGGSQNNSYLLSVGYDRNLQSLVTNSNNRLSLRAENTLRPFKGMQLYGRITYTGRGTARNNNFNAMGFGQIRPVNKTLYPYAALADEDGNPLAIDNDFRSSYTSTIGNGLLLDWQYRPLEEIQLADNSQKTDDLLINTGINYKLSNSLTADLKYQFEMENGQSRDFYSQNSYFARNLINRFSQISGTQIVRPLPLGAILDQGNSAMKSHGLRGQLNVAHSWSAKHELNGLIGAEVRDRHFTGNSYRIFGYDDDLLTTSNVDLVSSFPAYNNLAAASPIPTGGSLSDLRDRFLSFYANAGYTFDNRYSLTISARKDASNLFGVNTNQKGLPLGSAGLGWNISNEKFYKLDFLPYLKLRSSFGYSWNTNNTQSAYTTLIYQNPSAINNLRFAYLRNPPNANLRWEKVATWNLGLDFGAFENRLNGSFDVYSKRTSDLFGIEPLDPTTGFTTATINGASTRGKGMEVILNSRNLTGKIGWNTNLMIGYNKTVVERYLNSPTASSSIVNSGASINPIVDYPVYPLFSYAFGGLDGANGDPVGYIDGQNSKDYSAIVNRTPLANLVFHGSAIPLYNGSLRNTITWNNISLSANITFRFDYYFRRSTINYASLVNSFSGHPDYTLRWQKPGDEAITNVPSFVYPVVTNRERFYNSSNLTVEKGDHIRLSDIRLSYDLLKSQRKALPFNSAQLFIYSSNIGILWRANNYGLDPDYGADGIPPSRSISAGFRINL